MTLKEFRLQQADEALEAYAPDNYHGREFSELHPEDQRDCVVDLIGDLLIWAETRTDFSVRKIRNTVDMHYEAYLSGEDGSEEVML